MEATDKPLPLPHPQHSNLKIIRSLKMSDMIHLVHDRNHNSLIVIWIPDTCVYVRLFTVEKYETLLRALDNSANIVVMPSSF